MSSMFTLDEEKVEKRSTAATVKIVRNDEAELLQWTDTKLGRVHAVMEPLDWIEPCFNFVYHL